MINSDKFPCVDDYPFQLLFIGEFPASHVEPEGSLICVGLNYFETNVWVNDHGFTSPKSDGWDYGHYPLVNVYIAMERSTMLLIGISTISMAMFNSFLYAYQRVSQKRIRYRMAQPPKMIKPGWLSNRGRA